MNATGARDTSGKFQWKARQAGSTSQASSIARERGQALVEFAFSVLVFLLLVMGIFDLGRAVAAYNAISEAARAAARVGMLKDEDTKQDVIDAFNAQSGMFVGPFDVRELEMGDVLFCPGDPRCDPSDPDPYVKVTVTARYQPLTGSLLGVGGFDMSASSQRYRPGSGSVAIPSPSPSPSPSASPSPSPSPGPTFAVDGKDVVGKAAPSAFGTTFTCPSGGQVTSTVSWTPANGQKLHFLLLPTSAGSPSISEMQSPPAQGDQHSPFELNQPVSAGTSYTLWVYNDSNNSLVTVAPFTITCHES